MNRRFIITALVIILSLAAPFLFAMDYHSDGKIHFDCHLCLLALSPAHAEQPVDHLQVSFVSEPLLIPEAEAGAVQTHVYVFVSRAPPSA